MQHTKGFDIYRRIALKTDRENLGFDKHYRNSFKNEIVPKNVNFPQDEPTSLQLPGKLSKIPIENTEFLKSEKHNQIYRMS